MQCTAIVLPPLFMHKHVSEQAVVIVEGLYTYEYNNEIVFHF